jgi:hypothetical protein
MNGGEVINRGWELEQVGKTILVIWVIALMLISQLFTMR